MQLSYFSLKDHLITKKTMLCYNKENDSTDDESVVIDDPESAEENIESSSEINTAKSTQYLKERSPYPLRTGKKKSKSCKRKSNRAGSPNGTVIG